MGDSTATEAFTRRRRAPGRGASLLPVDGKSAAVCQSLVTANISCNNGEGKRDHSLETVWKLKNEKKKKRRGDLSDKLR